MKKLISLSIISLAVFIPNIALSSPPAQEMSSEEKAIIRQFVCSNEDYTRGDVISAINSSNLSISNSQRNELADAVMNGQQMPEENKALICEN
ncbi:hypothetical protein Xen7305DRAFT_00022560 [Xenococcus sp. PCC 7305]|uniref:hypothetical protein n=1 Tax=Xenococcus sp. PCC 7305 TaxID=102125 RepID=UPI0002AC3B5D|nr:hypothetical protein [Xenococcus sp. PCC 7305]ELS02542.1 hypothetical protein Xen7305DRAFT_00022560 [Xenococcus sp. PCC 7305]